MEGAGRVAEGSQDQGRQGTGAVADAEHHPDHAGDLLGSVGGVERQGHHEREDRAVAEAEHAGPGQRMRRVERDPERSGREADAGRRQQRAARVVEAVADERDRDRGDDREDVDRDDELPGVARPTSRAR